MIDPVTAISTTFLLSSAAFSIWLHTTRGLSGQAAAEAGTVLLTGLTNTVLMAGHLIGITATRLNDTWKPQVPGDVFWVFGFPYDFRFYSLALVGLVVLAQGWICLRAALPIARNEACSRHAAFRAVALTLLLLVPLTAFTHYIKVLVIPTVAAALALVAGLRRERFRQRLGPVVATVPVER